MSLHDIPCAQKARFERNAIDELRLMSDQEEKKVAETRRSTTPTALLDHAGQVNEDGLNIMYKLLTVEDDKTVFKYGKSPLSCWQVCPSVEWHKSGYGLDAYENYVPASRKGEFWRNEPDFCSRRSCSYANWQKGYRNDNSNLQPNSTKDQARVQNDFVIEEACYFQDGAGRVAKNASRFSVSFSPHGNFRFHHFRDSDFHMKHYREKITNFNIAKHVQSRLKENSLKKSGRRPRESNSKVCYKNPSFTFYRFCIPKERGINSGAGILTVVPCPGVANQNQMETEQRGERKSVSPGKKPTLRCKFHRREMENSPTLIKIEGRGQRNKNNFSTSSIAQNERENCSRNSKTEPGEERLKKVDLKFEKRPTESSQQTAKNRTITSTGKSKYAGRPLVQPYNCKSAVQSTRNGSDMFHHGKVWKRPTFGEKEFLRITTPKPLTHTCSLTPSDLDESPIYTPKKSISVSPVRSPLPIYPRNQLIAEILMKRETQSVFPKHSNFQACITPSNYSKSSMESHIRHQKEFFAEDDSNHSEELDDTEDQDESCCSNLASNQTIGSFISR